MTAFRICVGFALAFIGWLSAPAGAQAPPTPLATRIQQLGTGFNGRVGIAVQAVEGGWRVGYKAQELYPQQSVSKFWVAMTALDAVDKRRVRLSDPVTVTRGDLTLFNQPIAARVLKAGSVTTTLGALMYEAITKSDNTANDRLMRVVGGPPAVRAMLAQKRLGQIRFYEGERALQSRIAGVTWMPSYSVGGGFTKARAMVPLGVRRNLFNRYIEDPYDGAAPAAVVDALARLKRGELLSPSSSAHLLTTMSNTRTGKNRLRGGIRPGWTLSHKTGTGQELGGVQAGYNDIGVITAPNGQSYAIAVMIKRTSAPVIARMTLMNNVVRAVIDAHQATHGNITL